MLRCPSCGNQDAFVVREVVLQDMPITCHGPDSYTCGDPTCIDVEEWVRVTCDVCNKEFEEQAGKDAYTEAHPEEDAPIPYVLVDASVA